MGTACQNLVSEYDAFESMVAGMAAEHDSPVTQTWVREMQKTERLLELGRKSGVRNLKSVLGDDVEDGGIREDDINLDYRLLKSLTYAERGVRRMVKGLPEEQDM